MMLRLEQIEQAATPNIRGKYLEAAANVRMTIAVVVIGGAIGALGGGAVPVRSL